MIKKKEVKIENNVPIEYFTVLAHTFSLGDVEDPELYAAVPILEWQQSEEGKWIMEHAAEPPYYQSFIDYSAYGYKYAIYAKLQSKNFTFWSLKFRAS